MTTLNQRSMTGGELAPSLYARVDTAKYQSGLRTCRNFEVMRHGGVQNRPGTKYLAAVKNSSHACRLLPFIFNDSQTYVLEFGDQYIRFYKAGAQLGAPYELATAFLESELFDISYAQSADVMMLSHPSHPTYKLARLADTSWTITALAPAPSVSRPTGVSSTVGAAGASEYRYKVTAVTTDYEESLPGITATQAITGITQANPAVVTYAGADNFKNGSEILITGVVGMTQVNGKVFTVANVNTGANTFELLSTNSTSYTAYSSGGVVAHTNCFSLACADPTVANPNVVSWTAVSTGEDYNIYRDQSGFYGLIGTTKGTSFSDTGITPDVSLTPPKYRDPVSASGDYPAAVGFYQQRLLLAGSNNNPETVYASRTGFLDNFTISRPLQSGDAVTFTMAGRQVNRVKHVLDLGKLLVLTSGGEWAVNGDASGAVTPTDINAKQYSYYGSSSVPPLVIGNNALFVQARGSIVRDLSFDFQSDGYKGNDLTLFSAHLFDNNTITDWAYQQIPHSIVWVIRDDGTMLGLTYIPEQQIWGWHRHDTDGTFESVCSIPEGNEDAVYVVVNRGGGKYVERMHTRKIDDIVDAVFLDSSVTYDGRNTAATTMTLSGSGWTSTDPLTLTASAATFSSGDIGTNQYWLTGADGEVIRCRVTAYTSTTVVTVLPNRTVPASLRATATTTWSKAKKTITGLSHLNGKNVACFADGFVTASPNNASVTTLTVSGGQVVLSEPHAVVHVGLPYIADIETLDVDTVQGETIADKKKNVTKVSIYTEASRGVWAGAKPPTDDTVDPLEGLNELKVRESETYEQPVALNTGVVSVNIKPEWNSNGRVFLRQVDPVPVAILALAPAGFIPK